MQTARAPCSRKTTLTPHAWTYLHLSFFLSGLHSELDDTNLKDVLGSIFLRPSQSSSEFPPETRHVLQVETWLLRGGVNLCQPRRNTSHALPCKATSIQVERRCPRGPRLWQDVGTSNRFQLVRAQVLFSFFHKSHPSS